jgi:arylsulfatase
MGTPVAFDDDVWELYDGTRDWSQSRNLAAAMPAKLRELQRLFLIEAAKYNVLPLDDRQAERINPDLAGRPTLIHERSQVLYPGMGRLNENCIVNILNKSHAVTAEIVVEMNGHTGGVIVNQGGATGGWALYLKEGRPHYCYNFVGVERFTIAAKTPLSGGLHQLRVEFAYDGGGLGKGGYATLIVDGKAVDSTRIRHTHVLNFSLDETLDVGRDAGSPVTPDYVPVRNTFPGRIHWVRIDLGADRHDHLLDPRQAIHVAMSKQ